MRSACVAAIVTLLGLVASAALAADGPQPSAPAARTVRIGGATVTVLRGGGWFATNDGTVFGLNASQAQVTALLKAAGASTDKVTLDVDVLLLRLPGHVALIDAGLGPRDHGVLIASLALAGVSPGEITDVLITHGHTDHVGGLLNAAGRPAFPRATVHMSTREWASLKADKWMTEVATAIAPQVRTFEPGRPVLPGITPRPLYGHTPGHVAYEIALPGGVLEDIGDTAHSVVISLARPDWTIDFDQDRAAGAMTRRTELARLAGAGEWVFAPHFPFPGIGRIVARGDGYAWIPRP